MLAHRPPRTVVARVQTYFPGIVSEMQVLFIVSRQDVSLPGCVETIFACVSNGHGSQRLLFFRVNLCRKTTCRSRVTRKS